MAELETLEIKVKWNTEEGQQGLENLKTTLNQLKTAFGQGKGGDKAANTIEKIGNAAKSVNGESAGNISSLATALEAISKVKISASIANQLSRIGEALKSIDFSSVEALKGFASTIGAINASGGVGNLKVIKPKVQQEQAQTQAQEGQEPEKDTTKSIGETNAALEEQNEKAKETEKSVRSLAKAFSSVKNEAKDFSKGAISAFSNASKSARSFLNSIVRIAKYRLIRSAMKAISQGFKEGLANAYQFSKINGTGLSKSLDRIASSAQYLKNSIGAAISPLINALAPAFDYIIDKIVEAINWFNRFIAFMTGSNTWTKATRQTVEYAAATDKATAANNKFKASLLGFDEINALTDQSSGGSGGGGGGGSDYASMFEEVPIGEMPEFLVDLKMTFNDLLVDWKDANPEQKAEKISAAVFGLLGGIAGILFTGSLSGGIIGTIAGVGLGVLFNTLVFDHDGKISKEEGLTMLSSAALGLAGGIAGGLLTKSPKGAIVGALAGASLGVLFSKLTFDNDGEISKEEGLKLLIDVAFALAGGIFGGIITKSAKGAIVGMIAGEAIGVLFNKLTFDNDGEISKEEALKLLIDVALSLAGGVAGGLLTKSPKGALVGSIVGGSIGVLFNKLIFNNDGEVSKDEIFKMIDKVVQGLLPATILPGIKIKTGNGETIEFGLTSSLVFTFENIMLGIEKLKEKAPHIKSGIETLIRENLINPVITALANAWNEIASTINDADFLDLLPDLPTIDIDAIVNVKDETSEGFDNFIEKYNGIESKTATVTTDLNDGFKSKAGETVGGFVAKVWNEVTDKNATLTTNLNDGFKSKAGETVGGFVANIWNKVTDETATLTTNLKDNVPDGGVKGWRSNVWDKTKDKDVNINTKLSTSNDDVDRWKTVIDKWWGSKNLGVGAAFNSDSKDKIKSTGTGGWWSNIKTWWGEKKNLPIGAKNTTNKTDVSGWWSNIQTIWGAKQHYLKATASVENIVLSEKAKRQQFEFTVQGAKMTATMHTAATGGIFSSGEMWIARENGIPEMIGKIGSKAGVANNDQITEGIASAVYSANQEQNALLRQQNALLQRQNELLAQNGGNGGGTVSVSSMMTGMDRYNRRAGRTVVSVATA